MTQIWILGRHRGKGWWIDLAHNHIQWRVLSSCVDNFVHCYYVVSYPGCHLERLRRKRNFSVRIAGLCVENQIRDLQKTKMES